MPGGDVPGTLPTPVPAPTCGGGVGIGLGAEPAEPGARDWRSFLKCDTARSVKSVRLPPLTTSSPSAVTSSVSLVWSWRR
jgi:hypothetical protein